jgi:hypothetical protein
VEKQQVINRQLDESEKKFNLRVEESNRIINENEKIFLRRMDEKKQQLVDSTSEIENEFEELRKTEQNAIKIKQSENKKFIQKTRLHDGELDKYFVCSGIIKRFNELGYYFDDISLGGRMILDDSGKTKTEFGIIFENIHSLVVVELIANPKKKDIEHHINNLLILREHRNKYKDKRKIYGAIAGLQFGNEEKQDILENGIYLFEQFVKTIKLNMPDNFFPHEF